jgi:hypothetical protein
MHCPLADSDGLGKKAQTLKIVQMISEKGWNQNRKISNVGEPPCPRLVVWSAVIWEATLKPNTLQALYLAEQLVVPCRVFGLVVGTLTMRTLFNAKSEQRVRQNG